MLFECVFTVLNEMNSMLADLTLGQGAGEQPQDGHLPLTEVGRHRGERSRCSAGSDQALTQLAASKAVTTGPGSGHAWMTDRASSRNARAAAGSPVAWAAMLSATWACAISTGPLPW